jgi:hypothetical protein
LPILLPETGKQLRPLSKVAAGREFSRRGGPDVLDDDGAAGGAGDSDIDGIDLETAGVLEEVVVTSSRSSPGLSIVGTDFEALDGEVAVADLHAEPVRACA